ncbi:molybdopterin-guanine dinucleotide biosynthesis protein B [Paenibacillus mendelii]|uniref:Molybdopterin-guanine dinucleotide biosynthesis protein B n=1 Tax=Paenibacillus mendelii TaxID=206163 RepID=A0ABV6JK32_9BACL|nr:molybdopterin-guanine dinucleotide biosynthesis protein B [Paenibacillus mendelii]
MTRIAGPYILQIVGYKNRGKTTLIVHLTKRLKAAGFSVGTVKHDAHDFTMDTPETDTWKHQEAGADITAISSSTRSAMIRNHPQPLNDLLGYMNDVDIILVEGFKHERYPKLVLIRSEDDTSMLHELTSPLAAIVWPEASHAAGLLRTGDQAFLNENGSQGSMPLYDIHDIEGVAAFVFNHLHKHRKAVPL